jgi:hypothetical protein
MLSRTNTSDACVFKVVSPTEIMLKVPDSVADLSEIRVTTRSGALAPVAFGAGPNASNDTYIDATILPPEGGAPSSRTPSNFLAFDFSDPYIDPQGYYFPYRSAWYSFSPAVSGVYVLEGGAAGYATDLNGDYVGEFIYDPRVGVFDGDPAQGLSNTSQLIGSNRAWYGNVRPEDAALGSENAGLYFSSVSFFAETGKTYWVLVGGYLDYTSSISGYRYYYGGSVSVGIRLDKAQ